MDLNAKYRPQTFDDVLGQRSTIRSLRDLLMDKTLLPHAFMFSGPAGVGKTSLARIVVREIGVKPYNIVEQDALTNSTNEAMKELIATMRYPAMGGSPYRAVILDEVHSLSKSVWQTILKDIEEPPAHLFWILCTTEYGKLPDTLLQRLHRYTLKPVSTPEILRLLHDIRQKENFSVTAESLSRIADKSNGSPRLALALLSATRSMSNEAEVTDLLEETMSHDIKELCALLCEQHPDFSEAYNKLRALSHENVEIVRRNIIWYATKKFFFSSTGTPDPLYLRLLRFYGTPLHADDGIAPLVHQVTQDARSRPVDGLVF